MVYTVIFKPTQHSIKELQGLGIRPDVIVGRSDNFLDEDIASKIAFFADIPREAVISAPDAKTIYEVPLIFLEQKFPELIEKRLGLKTKKPNVKDWENFVNSKEKVQNKDISIDNKAEENLLFNIGLLSIKPKIIVSTENQISRVWPAGL